jgi:hypothetical protein
MVGRYGLDFAVSGDQWHALVNTVMKLLVT